MNLIVTKNGLTIHTDGPMEEVFVEKVLGLQKKDDCCAGVRCRRLALQRIFQSFAFFLPFLWYFLCRLPVLHKKL